jgi:CelD/BcsL family acetyltransferase involved in cellulose biosynthesis
MEQGVRQRPAIADWRAGPSPSSILTPSARLTPELRSNLDLRPEDAAALDTLIEGRPEAGVFLSKAWLSGFFIEPPSGIEPSVVMMREGSALRAIVPIAVCRELTYTRVALLGGGGGSDRVDLLAARGFEAASSEAFLAWLGESFGPKGFVLELRSVPGDSPLWGAVHRAGTGRGPRLALAPRQIHALPYLDLDEASSRLGGDGAPDRSSISLDKHRRLLERRCRFRIEMLQEPGEVMAAFELLVQLLHARWHGRGHGSALDNAPTQRFHRHVIPLLLREGRLRMIRLSADMRTIAVFYGLATGAPTGVPRTAAASGGPRGGWWGYYLAGFDREWAGRIHLGRITLAAAIECASREGAAEFDFLKGAKRARTLWPVRERVTVDADLYSARAGAQLRRMTRASREAAVALARSARGLFSS